MEEKYIVNKPGSQMPNNEKKTETKAHTEIYFGQTPMQPQRDKDVRMQAIQRRLSKPLPGGHINQ